MIFTFFSCNLIIDKDTTAEISKVSRKPVIELLGDPILSLPVGSTYEDAGVNAYEGDSPISYQIVSGKVNPNQAGFYVVTYKAVNTYGWESFAYRAVLVYSGSAYGTDISGTYYKGFNFLEEISKYQVNGYWQISNVWQEEGVSFPLIFADKGDGTYGIVPGDHPTKGRYEGYAVQNGTDKIHFFLKITSPDGDITYPDLTWTKQ